MNNSSEDSDSWFIKPNAPQYEYQITDAFPSNDRLRNRSKSTRGNSSRGASHGQTRDEAARSLYAQLEEMHGISSGSAGVKDYCVSMEDENLPAEENFRKAARVTANRVGLDMNNRKLKRIIIQDRSNDDFVIPCTFPAVLDVQMPKIKGAEPLQSTTKIEQFLLIPPPVNRWAGDEEDAALERKETIEELMVANAVNAAAGLDRNGLAICLSMEDYPPTFVHRNRVLKTIVIDGCAVMKQVNYEFEVGWNYTGGATQTFRRNKVLLMKPLIELTMRFLLQGHSIVIILPVFYKNPIFVGVRQKVDDLCAFNALVDTGIVHFIEEENMEEWNQKLAKENDQREGLWVSTSDLERMIAANVRWKEVKEQREAEQMAAIAEMYGESSQDARQQQVNGVKREQSLFRHRITPFYYDNHLVLPLHMSTNAKELVMKEQLLYFEESMRREDMDRMEERREKQMSMKEQLRILLALQDLFELPLKLLRGMQMMRRIVKEIGESEEEMKKIEDEMALREVGDDVQRAFLD
ncbi:hypothetical protein PFISCL1PPCAC_8204 [Pristionchus fissidentatus]|uniref:Zc3h12a-like Ribonuclease NYN domain-containing protein n=1 Tax=Pristionchus fissidentatus TaxID=1538716 RepID=A0AAV5VDU2_9BILA|nr:hypothetical protein PFISCL1PPCAC_8204 [Pristionchus fissidentatus]